MLNDFELPGWKKLCAAKSARREYWRECRLSAVEPDMVKLNELCDTIDAAHEVWKAEIAERDRQKAIADQQRFDAIAERLPS
jgi:hypothetical protein